MKKAKDRKNYQRGDVVKLHRSQIVEDDINPRTITDENMRRLKASIEKNGLVGHLVWNKATGHVVGGHQRLSALDSLMHTKDYDLDVLAVDMPLKDEVRLNVALNQQDAQGEFDFDAIAALASDFNLSLSDDFNFSPEVIEINFPEFDLGGTKEEEKVVSREASEEDIAKMKEAKKATRERNKEFRQEFGDYNGEPKGVLTIVFDRESAKQNWFQKHGFDEAPSVMHVYDFEKLFDSKSLDKTTRD